MDAYAWAKFFNYTLLIAIPVITLFAGFGSWYFNSKTSELDNNKIAQRDVQIEELETKLKDASRGISSSYDFNGAKRETTRPGHINLAVGPETEVFKKMNELIQNQNLKELIDVAEKQIEETPEWLTPYLYLGAAYADTGEHDKAIEKLEYVLDQAPNDPAYAPKAKEIIDKINQK